MLDNPQSIFGFDDNNVWITGTTLQELDAKKRLGSGEIRFNARECCRILDNMRQKEGYSLLTGVQMDNGGKLFVQSAGVDRKYLPDGYSIDVPDNRIISTCHYIDEFVSSKPELNGQVILVTNDVSLRVNADICGVCVQEYKNDIVKASGYKGFDDVGNFERIDEIFKNGTMLCPDELISLNGEPLNGTGKPLENEYLTLHYGNASALTVYRAGLLTRIKEQMICGWVKPKNSIQSYAMHALLAPPEEIPLVIISGPAGTAKTFLSLAAGMEKTYVSQKRGRNDGGVYRKIMISRPNVETDAGFGYLPGDLQSKMDPLLAPYYDNLEILLRGRFQDESDEEIRIHIEDLLEDGVIEICPLSHIRGRNIPGAFIICDEAQNAKKSLIRDVVTRAGEGAKVVICGDPNQIDAPTLDIYNNGIVYAVESMKGDMTTAIINGIPAKDSVRSKLSQTAIQRML